MYHLHRHLDTEWHEVYRIPDGVGTDERDKWELIEHDNLALAIEDGVSLARLNSGQVFRIWDDHGNQYTSMIFVDGNIYMDTRLVHPQPKLYIPEEKPPRGQ